jgi:hypothetical protein
MHNSGETRLSVTTMEFKSPQDALEGLARELNRSQLPFVRVGPSDLGTVSFLQPEMLPPAVFFVRENVVITVRSELDGDDLLRVARRIDGEVSLSGGRRRGVLPLRSYRTTAGRGTL